MGPSVDTMTGQPVRMLTDVQTGQLLHQPHQPSLSLEPSSSLSTSSPYPCLDTSLPPPEYQQTVDFTITKQPQASSVSLEDEIAALNALNQEREEQEGRQQAS